MSMPSMIRGEARQAQDLAQPLEALARVDAEDLRLHVEVDVAGEAQRLQGLDLVAQPRGVLEPHVLAGLLHLRHHLLEHDPPAGAHELDQPLDVLAVLFLADPRAAGGGALADVEQDARPEELAVRVVLADVQAAGAELERLLEGVDRRPQAADADERAVELRVGPGVAGDVDGWEIVLDGDLEVREGLVVAQPLVVGRLDVLDEAVFLEQGVDLGVALDPVDVDHLLGHLDDVRAAGCRQVGGVLEVAGDAGAQVHRLADVQHPAQRVLEQVDARVLGQAFYFLPDGGYPGLLLRVTHGSPIIGLGAVVWPERCCWV